VAALGCECCARWGGGHRDVRLAGGGPLAHLVRVPLRVRLVKALGVRAVDLRA